MSNTVIITSVYQEFWGTEQFRRSVDRIGGHLINAFRGNHFTGNGDVIKNIYLSLLEMAGLYKYAIYSDGADSFFVKSFTPPDGVVIYSAEKAIWPPRPDLSKEYPPCETPWKYLNGGGYCGEVGLLIEFFDRYGLSKLTGEVNGQLQQAQAFLQAKKDGFPIELDTKCEYFQTTGFEDPGDFKVVMEREYDEWPKIKYSEPIIVNNKTGAVPCVLHGNGRTGMDWIYNLYK